MPERNKNINTKGVNKMYKCKLTTLVVLLYTVFLCAQTTDTFESDKIDIFSGTIVEQTWQDVKNLTSEGYIVLLPISVIEEHGPHMDLSPDIRLTNIICKKIQSILLQNKIKSVIGPPMYWGINSPSCTGNFTGSFSVSPSTFKSLLNDIASNFQHWGFKTVLCVNIHGDMTHGRNLEESVNYIQRTNKYNIVNVGTLPVSTITHRVNFAGTFDFPDYHAGANETAQMWSSLPELVDTSKAKQLKYQKYFNPLGYVGGPSNFDKYDGDAMLNLVADDYAQRIINYLKKEK
jgi:creatinine amidohydrolase